LVVLGAATLGWSQPDSLLRLTPARRYEVITEAYYRAFKHDTNTARKDAYAVETLRHELDAMLGKRGTSTDQLQAEMARLEIERHFRVHLNTFLTRVADLMQRAEADHDTISLARGHINLGLFYFQVQKKYYLAFRHYGLAFDLMRHRTQADLPLRSSSIYQMALASYQFFDYRRAITMALTIHPVGTGGVHPRPSVAATLYNESLYPTFNAGLLGLSYLHLRQYDSARVYFEWGLRQLPVPDLNNRAWEGIFNGNLGRVLVRQHRLTAALPYLEKGLNLTIETQVWDNVVPFGTELAQVCLGQRRYSQALAYAQLAHQAARRTGEARFLHETHRALATCYEEVGQPALAVRHADSAAQAKDQWQAEVDVTLKHRAEMVLEAERYQALERALQAEHDHQVLLRNGLLAFVALLSGMVWLWLSRRLSQQRQRQAEARAEQEKIAADLRLAEARLAEFTRNVQEKSALLDRLREGAEGEAPAAVPQAVLDRLRDSVLLTDRNWEEFSALFERVHAGFFKRLTRAYPGLTPAEVRFAALTRLSYTPREMAAMLGVGPDAIRQHRRRLRLKLGLTDDQPLDEAIARV
jgi:DNA-binding CsgD family transcriptional regulator/tetratricopeptide (TPR) repeat protein